MVQKKKKIILVMIVLMSSKIFATCITAVPLTLCDSTVSYAMYKQRTMIEDRMDDFDKTINKMKEETQKYNILLMKEGIDLIRLRERYNIRLLSVMELNHNYKKAKDQEKFLSEVKTIAKKKEVK